ncbi:MAG: hypothetical protein ACHQ9S_18930 [Candidatus Binatia bacterium]
MDEFKGLPRVVASHVMAGFASLGGTLGRSATGLAMAEDPAHAEDAAKAGHDYIDKLTDDAHAHWIGKANDQEAGGGSQILGRVAETLPSMLAGPLGMPIIAGDQKNHELLQQGIDARTAAKEAVTTALATAAGLKISHAFPAFLPAVRATLQHLITGAAGNIALQAGQDALDKYILSSDGYKEAAAQIDPTDPPSIAKSGIMGVIYGLINSFTHGGAKKAPPGVQPDPHVSAGVGEPPPPPPGPNAQPVTAEPVPGPNAKPVSAEPVPGPAAKPVTAPPLEGAQPPAAKPVTPPAAEAPKEAAPAAAAPTGPKKGDRVIVTVGGEERPVVIDGPAEGNKVPVRAIDDDGNVSKVVTHVTTDMLPKLPEAPAGKPATPAEPAVPAKEPAAGGTTKVGGVEVKEGESVQEATKKYVAQKKAEEAQPVKPAEFEQPAPVEAGKTNKVVGAEVAKNVATQNTDEEAAKAELAPKTMLAMEKMIEPTEGTKEPIKGSPLQQAADFYDKTNTPKPGKKRANTVPQHVDEVASLGRALQEHIKDYPDADPKVIEHANEVAKRAANLDALSEDANTTEAMNKGRRGSHSDLDDKAQDIKRAITNLDNPDKSPDLTITQTKARALKAKVAAAKEPFNAAEFAGKKVEPNRSEATTEAPKPKEPEAPKPTKAEELKAKQAAKAEAKAKETPSGIKSVEDATKPKVLNAGNRERIGGAFERYRKADPDRIEDAHSNLQRVLRTEYGEGHENEADTVLQMMREQRADEREAHIAARQGRTGKISDTITDEDLRQGHEDKLPPREVLKLRAKTDVAKEGRFSPLGDIAETVGPLGKLHGALQKTGFWRNLDEMRRQGGFVGTHAMLDHLIKVSHDSGNDLMDALLSKVRQHVSDAPIRPVSDIVHPTTGKSYGALTAGLFHPRTNTLQVRINKLSGATDRAAFTNTHAIPHEIIHAATSQELARNPNGEFAQDVRTLLNEARARAEVMGEGGKLELDGTYKGGHYGLTDEHEFLAEAGSSDEFKDFLARSEAHKQASYTLKSQGLVGTLLDRIAIATAKLFGIKNPAEAKLLRDAMGLTQRGMELQSAHAGKFGIAGPHNEFLGRLKKNEVDYLTKDVRLEQANEHMPGPDEMLDKARALQDPPPLQHEGRFREVAGDAMTSIARGFRQTVRSGLIQSMREGERGLTAHDQLVRVALRRGVFGHNEPGNPVRDYDEAVQEKNTITNKMTVQTNRAIAARAVLPTVDDRALGNFQIAMGDKHMWIDRPKDQQPEGTMKDKNFDAKWNEMQTRWEKLGHQNHQIQTAYLAERDYNDWSARQARKASVDLATDSFTQQDLSKAKRSLLYSARDMGDYDSMIGPGKMIDVGDKNDSLKETLKDVAGQNEIEGDYFHQGRPGDWVVHVNPEVDKNFDTRSAAETHAEQIRSLSPNSKAEVKEIGGKWNVSGKAEYTSMHEGINEATAAAERMEKAGFDVGPATRRIESSSNAALPKAFETIYSEVGRRLDRHGGETEAGDKAIEDTKAALRTAFVTQLAARSAYAGSKLARRNVGGVNPEEMGRNFAQHAISQAWNVAHMSTVIKTGEALGRLKEAVKDRTQDQGTAIDRGNFYDEMQKRVSQEVSLYGKGQPINSAVAKIGFMYYMSSLSHAMLYLTQNFTAAGVAAPRFGAFKTAGAFASAMKLVASPAFRETYREILRTVGGGGSAENIQKAMLAAVAQHPRFGKWAKGENSPLQQLLDRGIIHTSLSNQLALATKSGSDFSMKVMNAARLSATLADYFNRTSTGLAALELHKGDVYKAADFVKETHIDYSQENKPRAFKAVSKLFGGNSVTMFRSFMQGMTHLVYSHIYDSAVGDAGGSALGGRATALKTVAGVMIGQMLFAGVQRSVGLEPIRAAAMAYHHLAGDNDEFYDFDNSVSRAFHAMSADNVKLTPWGTTLADVLNRGLPAMAGFDMSSRMGLSDLFFHNAPDMLALKEDQIIKAAGALLGPGVEAGAQTIDRFNTAFQSGRLDDWLHTIPVKAWQNVYDSIMSATKGKMLPSGAQITQPGIGPAISHLVGFRTNEEARLAGKSHTETEYKQWVDDRRQTLTTNWAKAAPGPQRQAVQNEINKFNAKNPGAISVGDQRKAATRIIRQQNEAQGLPGKNPTINELRSH